MNALKEYFTRLPLPVTIASLFVLSITTWNGVRAYTALIDWDILSRFNQNPLYIFATGLVWVVAGMALSITILNGKQFALSAGLISSMVYIIWYWLDRLIIQVSPASNAVFSTASSTIVFTIFNIILFWPSSQAFFIRRQDEQ